MVLDALQGLDTSIIRSVDRSLARPFDRPIARSSDRPAVRPLTHIRSLDGTKPSGITTSSSTMISRHRDPTIVSNDVGEVYNTVTITFSNSSATRTVCSRRPSRRVGLKMNFKLRFLILKCPQKRLSFTAPGEDGLKTLAQATDPAIYLRD